MGWSDALRENRDTLLRGVALMVGGATLVLAASLIGYGEGKTFDIVAGLLGIGGVTSLFLGFFLYVLPPILPGK